MMRNEEDAPLRRYVLGKSPDDECEAIESDFFERASALDQMSAAEEELIDDYLSGRLAHADRDRFERHYLSTPNHRRRVAVVRGIRTAAAKASTRRSIPEATTGVFAPEGRHVARWLGLAASLVILVGTATWIFRTDSGEDTVAVQSPPVIQAPTTPGSPGRGQSREPARETSPAKPSSQPVVVAVTISPVLIRSADEQPGITIATGTDIVRLQLRGRPGEPLERGRSVIRTVAGREVWRGPATAISGSPRQVFARVDVPASMLRADDYIVELFGRDAGGREVERYKYFLRVQTP